MYFQVKKTLKNNYNYIVKHPKVLNKHFLLEVIKIFFRAFKDTINVIIIFYEIFFMNIVLDFEHYLKD